MPNPPIYIEMEPETILAEMTSSYESATGNTLQPFQVENLLISTWALRESLLRGQVQSAALQNLVSFSTEPVIDYLGELVGATRLEAAKSVVTIQFLLNSGSVTIPSGTRVASADGTAVFETEEDLVAGVGVFSLTAVCSSVTEGATFNGYAVGSITNILDPQAFLTSAENTDVSSGGSARETDDEYRDRIRLAPDTFGTAGSRDAYKFWAKSANPLIIDVAVVSDVPGTVEIFPLLEDGSITPSLILDQVSDVCSAEDVRPLTDTVVTTAPTQVLWSVSADLVIYEDADPTDIVVAVKAALDAYALSKRQSMGQDIVLDQLIATAMVDGVYSVDFGAATDIVIDYNEYAKNTSINVNVTGTNEG